MSSSLSFPRPTTTIDDHEDLYTVYGLTATSWLTWLLRLRLPKPFEGDIAGPISLSSSLVDLLSRSRSLSSRSWRGLNPGTFLVSPRLVRHVIEDFPYHDEKWREQFFLFKVDRASALDFDFSRLLRNWAENICYSFGSFLMSEEIRGLIGVLRKGRLYCFSFDRARIRTAFAMPEGTNMAPLVGGSEDEAEHSQGVVATPSVQAQSLNRLVRQLARRLSFRASGSVSRNRASDRPPLVLVLDSEDESASLEGRSPILLSPGSEDETVAATRKRRRSSRAALPSSSRPRLVPEGDGSLFAAQGDLISLAGCMRSVGCHLPSLASLAEKEAYAKVAVASSKVMEAFNEYVVVMEDRVEASRNDKKIESIGSEIKRLSEEHEVTKREGKRDAEKIEALAKIKAFEVERDRDIRRASRIARCDIEKRYREVLESLKGKWMRKTKEASAEIQLQEVTANIDLLNELKDGGLTVDAELAHLKDMEGDCEGLVASVAVSDWSISRLDLPQIYEDLVDQFGGSSVPDESASS
ncbi:hypothetical protein F2Q69_00021504 [Brassica cretica]|uniref:Uncharacterized protein n=1 Tax=Brassica cretica TaxID=69181 RepID=A0A8S9QF46_BRACR|nr:hypothetical protein F2Q69_00021504 [Brassica cretica]